MPYLEGSRRLFVEMAGPKTSADLNYLFSFIIKDYLDNIMESYQTYNDIIGALEACKLELYRRKVAPYEDKKILQNGDVY